VGRRKSGKECKKDSKQNEQSGERRLKTPPHCEIKKKKEGEARRRKKETKGGQGERMNIVSEEI